MSLTLEQAEAVLNIRVNELRSTLSAAGSPNLWLQLVYPRPWKETEVVRGCKAKLIASNDELSLRLSFVTEFPSQLAHRQLDCPLVESMEVSSAQGLGWPTHAPLTLAVNAAVRAAATFRDLRAH